MELTKDQQQFDDVVKRFFSEQSLPDDVRRLMETATGFDKNVWQRMSSELGLTGLHIPEQYGGYGFGTIELGLTLKEMGRSLYCGPFFASSVMSAYALLVAATEGAKQELLPLIADGSQIFTLVLDSLDNPANWGQSLDDRQGKLFGRAAMVLDVGVADQMLVIAKKDSELKLLKVKADAPGVVFKALEVIDPTRKLYSVEFIDVSAEDIGSLSDSQVQDLWDRVCLSLANEMIGGAQYLLDSTIEYTKLRFQFGRPIGSFQGLKHRCAELLMELELAKGVINEATRIWSLDGDGFGVASGSRADFDNPQYIDSQTKMLPSMAKAMASDVYMTLAIAAVQLRGGIGFTWENDTHLWFKRAKSSEVFLGTAVQHRERMISILEGASDAA